MISFRQQAELFRRFLERGCSPTEQPPRSERLGIVVTRWNCNTVPWYALTLAYLLRARGYTPSILYDDMTEVLIPRNHPEESAILDEVLGALDGLEVRRLSRMPPMELDAHDQAKLDELVRLNAYYSGKTTVPNPDVLAKANAFADDFEKTLPRVKGLFAHAPLDAILIPGGLVGHSGLFMHVGKRNGTRTSTWDTGPGEFLLGTNDVAGYLRDIPPLTESAETKALHDQAVTQARDELRNRLSRADDRRFQTIAYDEYQPESRFDVVIPLNIECDTSALATSAIFDGLYDWLCQSTDFILEQTDATVAIRQHPSTYNYTPHLEEAMIARYRDRERVRIYTRFDKVNTYKLCEQAKLVLPWTSTVGVESASLGKGVIVANDVYYGRLGFAHRAGSKIDYFQTILEYLERPPTQSPEARETALLSYYFSQLCNYLRTRFTPIPEDFEHWINTSLDALGSNDGVNMILDAFTNGRPLAELNMRYQRTHGRVSPFDIEYDERIAIAQ